jgi:8-hydroxy-5-deazaflavin:NADPH oxidoreductase
LLVGSQHVKRCEQIPEDTDMQIAIIGAGNVGRALAGSLTRAGHDVTVSATNPEHAKEAATATGATAASTNADAVSNAAVVVLAVPATSLDDLAAELGDALAGKIVVDVSNRPTPSPDGAPTSIAEELDDKLPGTSVVKAFNTAFASRMADPKAGAIAPDGYVAGDDAAAKQTVLDVVESIGFRPVDAGSLAAARTLEGMAWLNISRAIANGTWQDAWVLVGPELAATATENRN